MGIKAAATALEMTYAIPYAARACTHRAAKEDYSDRCSPARAECLWYITFSGGSPPTQSPGYLVFACGTGSCRNPKTAMRDTEDQAPSTIPAGVERSTPGEFPKVRPWNHTQGLAATCESTLAYAEPHFTPTNFPILPRPTVCLCSALTVWPLCLGWHECHFISLLFMFISYRP